jgi:hypothetical protein
LFVGHRPGRRRHQTSAAPSTASAKEWHILVVLICSNNKKDIHNM